MTSYETISLIIQCITTLFIGGSLIYTGKQLALLAKIHNDNHELNRRVATQNALKDFNTSVNLDKLQKEFNFLNRKHPIPVSEIQEAFNKQPGLQLQASMLLNQYEAFARGIFLGVYDETLVKNAREGSMRRTFTSFQEYITHRRNEFRQSAYIEYEKLVDKWDKEYKQAGFRSQTGKI